MDFLSTAQISTAAGQNKIILSLKNKFHIPVVPGGVAEPWGGGQGGHQSDDVQEDAVQDGGQLPDDKGVGPGCTAGRHDQAICFHPVVKPFCGTRGQQL